MTTERREDGSTDMAIFCAQWTVEPDDGYPPVDYAARLSAPTIEAAREYLRPETGGRETISERSASGDDATGVTVLDWVASSRGYRPPLRITWREPSTSFGGPCEEDQP